MNFDENLPWKEHPTYKNWVFADEVYCISGNNLRFYFIRQPGDFSEICALVDGDRVIKEFAILDSETVYMASGDPEIELEGICLDQIELLVSPNGERYAFPHFENGVPHIFVDGCSYEITNNSQDKITRGNPVEIGFSLDSTRLVAMLESWDPELTNEILREGDEESLEDSEYFDPKEENFDDKDFEDAYYLLDQPASFHIEMNGEKRSPIARAGTLIWYDYYLENKGLFGCRMNHKLVLVKAGGIALQTGKSLTGFCFTGTYNDGSESMCISNAYSAHSSDKRYFVYCIQSDQEIHDLYLIDTTKISSDDIQNSRSWSVKYPNVQPTVVFWKEDRFVVRHIKDQKPAILEIIV